MDISEGITIRQTKAVSHANSLWDLVRFEASKEGEVLGFIMVSFIPASRISSENIDTDILAYLKKSTGRGAGIVSRSYTCLDVAEEGVVRDIEYGINDLFNGWTYANQQQSLTSTRKERVCRIREMLPQLTERFDGERRSFLDFHVDKPMVDMVEVKPEQRRKGVGMSLYETAAKWAKEQGMILHASKVQTVDARAVWESLARRGLVDHETSSIQDKAHGVRPRMR